MKKTVYICSFVLMIIFYSQSVNAAEKENIGKPWERFSISLGGFASAIDSDLHLDVNGVGLNVSAEDALDLDSSLSVIRVDGYWRFTRNLRHRFEYGWHEMKRDGTATLLKDITIDNTTFLTGSQVTTEFNLEIFKGAYSYSVFQDDRMDIGVSFGVYVMPIDFEIQSTGALTAHEKESVTAPLPVLGLRTDFALTPKLFLKYHFDFFYLEMDQFKGAVTDNKILLEYNAFKHVGFGIGLERFKVSIEAEGEDYPNIDFNGAFDFSYVGAMLYCKVYF